MAFITVTYPPKYPLTDSEKKWLEERETYPIEREAPYFCAHCPKRGHVDSARDCLDYWSIDGNCPVESSDFRDAAEFEARVQKKLMYQYEKAVQCAEITGGFCPNGDTMLYYARLAVEEEMRSL